MSKRERTTIRERARSIVVTFLLLALEPACIPARAQTPLPGLPGTKQSASELSSSKAIVAPTDDNPEATAAEAAGPITAAPTVSDYTLRSKLEKLLPRYPGVRTVEVGVDDGVVTLTGHVADGEVRDRVRDFVRRVQGVNLVLNQLKTDAQVLTAREYALKQLRGYGEVIARKWLLWAFAVVLAMASLLLARLFRRYSDALLIPFTGNVLLRSVLGSVLTGVIALGGCLLGLQLLGMTEAVLSFLGLAGVAALAVGFAFRDIAENFIASVMLGFRRPFRVGDFIEVAGRSGVVRSLNTRATMLITLDGSQVRIPNAIIYKEVLVNRTASTSVRGSFDVLVPWDASVASSASVITEALREHEGFEEDPAPRTLVEAIEPGGIRLRSYFWFPGRGIDRAKLQSDALLAAKVALQKAGIRPAPGPLTVQFAGDGAPLRLGRRAEQATTATRLVPEQVQANLLNDTEAASIASAQLPQDQEDEIDRALDVVAEGVNEEGRNLIADKDKPARAEKPE